MNRLGVLAGKEEGNFSAGLYTDEGTVPLQGISIHVEVLDMASKTTIRQRFKNTWGQSIEVTYCFPTVPDAAVNGFRAIVGGNKIEGIVKQREEAFDTYDAAMEEGHGAFLMDQEEEDIFTVSVGNLKPDEEAEIEISYVATLKVQDKKVRLTIPTTISPRYIPSGSDPVKADRISPPVWSEVPYGLSIEVRIRQVSDLEFLASPSHKTKFRKEDGDLIVSLQQSETTLDRDFILEFESERFVQPKAIVSRHTNGKRAVMVNWIPDIPSDSPKEKEGIIFILDCSGSMSGSSIDEAKEALKQCVWNMESGVPFNILLFGSDYHALFEGIVPCTDENRKWALSRMEKIDADMGGTELMAPLNAAYTMMKEGFFNIFLLTDGEVGNVEEIVELAGRNRSRARVFSFGIGYGPSRALIEGVAKMSGGGSVFISPDESIEEKVIRQFRRLSTPKVVDISVDWGGLTVTDTPRFFPPIFSDEPLTFFGLVEKGRSEEVVLTGKTGGGTIWLVAPLTDIGEDNLVPVLWAKQRIGELEFGGFELTGSRQIERKSKLADKKIEKIALDFQLMSSRTSFVAVMERKDGEKSFEIPAYVRVPNQLTRGWHGMDRGHVSFSLGEPVAEYVSESSDFRMSMGIGEKSIVREPSRRIGVQENNEIKYCTIDILDAWTPKELEYRKFYEHLYNCRRDSGEFVWDSTFLSQYAFPIDELIQLAEKIERVPEELKNTVLMTKLALFIIDRSDLDELKREFILTKGIQWLSANAPDARIDGKPVQEALEPLIDLEKIFAIMDGKKSQF